MFYTHDLYFIEEFQGFMSVVINMIWFPCSEASKSTDAHATKKLYLSRDFSCRDFIKHLETILHLVSMLIMSNLVTSRITLISCN